MPDLRKHASWTSGYVGDVVYTLGFHRELAPAHLDFVCLINGVEGLPSGRRRRYCELGCGRGFGTTLLAASNPDFDFVGIDFNPSHIAEARSLAESAGIANVDFREMSFGDAARLSDSQLAAFDVIALHGVYSWVAAPVRAEIHELMRTKLISGGVAFVSYNTLPGWTRVIPTHRLLLEAASRATGDSVARVAKSMELLQLLVDKSDGMIDRHGALSRKYLAQLATKDKHYLAHEFLNAAWQPLFVTEAIAALAEVKLTYVGSGAIAENRPELCVPRDLRDAVRSAPDTAMRELLKDYILGQQFRRDVYVKGPRSMPSQQKRRSLMELAFAPMPNVKSLPEKLRVPIGEFTPRKDVIGAMWRCVEAKTATGAEILDAAMNTGERHEERVWTLIELMVHNGLIHPTSNRRDAVDHSASRRLNEAVLKMSTSTDTHRYLASPVLGSAIATNHPERIIATLIAQEPGLNDAAIAVKTFDVVEHSGQRLQREGHPIDRNDETVGSLAQFVREFREHRLPRWRLLGVVE